MLRESGTSGHRRTIACASCRWYDNITRPTDAPIEHVCLGEFPDDHFVVPSWLDMFLEGGAVTQDHFTLNDFNRGVLSARGRRDIFVTIRDPRAAASSHVHMRSAMGYRGSGPLQQRIERECLNGFIAIISRSVRRSLQFPAWKSDEPGVKTV
jgi:hypothetical protein